MSSGSSPPRSASVSKEQPVHGASQNFLKISAKPTRLTKEYAAATNDIFASYQRMHDFKNEYICRWPRRCEPERDERRRHSLSSREYDHPAAGRLYPQPPADSAWPDQTEMEAIKARSVTKTCPEFSNISAATEIPRTAARTDPGRL
jgi:hypothetical protein